MKSPTEYFDLDAISPENFNEVRNKSQILIEKVDEPPKEAEDVFVIESPDDVNNLR